MLFHLLKNTLKTIFGTSIKNKNTGWGVNPKDEVQLVNIFCNIDKTGENEFIEKQKNCLSVINNYSLDKFTDAIKKSSYLSIKKRKVIVQFRLMAKPEV